MPARVWCLGLWVLAWGLFMPPAGAAPGRPAPGGGGPAALAGTMPAPRFAVASGLGGRVGDMAVLGRHLVYGAGTALEVADASDPARPRPLGRTPGLGGLVAAIALGGTRAFVAAGPGGLAVVDLSAPERPLVRAVLALPGPARDLALAGDRAYVAADGAGLVVVSLGDPDRPQVVGVIPCRQLAARVVAAAGHAYVLTARRFGADSYAYDLAEAVEVFDLATGGKAKAILDEGITGAPLGPLAVSGSTLLVGTMRLGVWDIARPAAPARLADLDLGAAPRDFALPPEAPGELLVALGLGHPDSGQLARVSLADPRHPALLGRWRTGEAGQPGVAAGGGLVFADRPEGVTVAVLAQQPPNGPLLPAGQLPDLTTLRSVAARAGRLVLAAGIGGLALAQVEAGGAPALLGRTPAQEGGGLVDYTAVALPPGPADEAPSLAYALTRHYDVDSAALRVLDIADPARPRELGSLPTPREFTALAAGSGYAFVGLANGLGVVDARDPAQPAMLTTVSVSGGVVDLVLEGQRLYAATGDRMMVYDVSDPAKPHQVAAVYLPGKQTALAVQAGTAFVGVAMSGGEAGRLITVDVVRGGPPVIRATTPLSAPAGEVWADERQVLVALGPFEPGTPAARARLLTYGIDDSGWPRLVGGTWLADGVGGLAAAEGRAWAAAGEAGLAALLPGTALTLPALWR